MKNLPPCLGIYWFLAFFIAYLPAISAPKLDYAKVKSLYKEGEFEKVRSELESFLKKGESDATREDRISAYKYLGVIYGSKPGGRPQSETYFFRLLDLSPKVNLAELYVSYSVDQIFRETRERFSAEKQSTSSVDEFGNPKEKDKPETDLMVLAVKKNNPADTFHSTEKKSPIKNEPKSQQHLGNKKLKVWPWVVGATVVGGGVGLYLMTSQSQPEEQKRVVATD